MLWLNFWGEYATIYFGTLILEHVSEIMADTYNVSTHQKNK